MKTIFQQSDDQGVQESQAIIESYYNETLDYMEPLLAAFWAEENHDTGSSPWSIRAQHIIGDLQESDQHKLDVRFMCTLSDY